MYEDKQAKRKWRRPFCFSTFLSYKIWKYAPFFYTFGLSFFISQWVWQKTTKMWKLRCSDLHSTSVDASLCEQTDTTDGKTFGWFRNDFHEDFLHKWSESDILRVTLTWFWMMRVSLSCFRPGLILPWFGLTLTLVHPKFSPALSPGSVRV